MPKSARIPALKGTPETHAAIGALREKLGGELVIMGHHYQSDEVIPHVDKVGDSLELARMIDDITAKHIVFCGVHFMAETSCVLAGEGQYVYLPDPCASCVMADMVPAPLLEAVLKRLLSTGRKITPLAYVNTSLATKAVVGAYGGAVCTSANAKAMLKWALAQGDGVLFLPDKKLGNNSANLLGLPEDDRHVLDVRNGGESIDMDAARSKTLLLWPGCCAVHARFNPSQAEKARQSYPDARILVHPECSPALVAASDGAGSTSYLIKQAEEAPDGSTLVIGTEINLVQRLAKQHAGRVNIVPLAECACSNMAKITADRLLSNLRAIDNGTALPMRSDPALSAPARDSITRMLRYSAEFGG